MSAPDAVSKKNRQHQNGNKQKDYEESAIAHAQLYPSMVRDACYNEAMPSPDPTAPRRAVVSNPATLRRILIVKLSSLGDVVHALPLLEALRIGLGPETFIGWAVRDKFADLLHGNPHINTVYPLSGSGLSAAAAFGRSLRVNDWDAALDTQGLLLSGVVTRFSGAPLRIGLDQNREGNRFFLTHAVVPGRMRMPVVDKLLGFCDALGIPRIAPRRQAYLAEGEAEAANSLLAEAAEGPRAGLIVGASRADKAWPVERWIELSKRLADQGVRVVLLGGPGEVEMSAGIVEGAAGAVALNLAGRTTPRVLASVLARCGVVVGGDSGPTHLAVAVGAPVVGLYGVTDPGRTGPCWGPGPAIVIDYAEADAPPESRRPRHTTLTDALARIPAAATADAALRLLSGTNVSQDCHND